MSLSVPYINLKVQHEEIADEVMPKVESVIRSGQFILGKSVENFEKSFAELHKVKFAVGVANGTDALILALKALGLNEGDEIITCPNSYLASASSIVLAGFKAVFCDVDDDMNMDPESLEKTITAQTKAIIPVHLTGKPANMKAIKAVADKHDLFIVEDSAQAVGASYEGTMVGGLGDLGCFSLHPLKNLSACGDAGIITTNNQDLYNYLIVARNHGLKSRDECEFFSLNSRLDSLQAEILSVKLNHLPKWNERRRSIAKRYNEAFADFFRVPVIAENEYSVFHTYIIQTERRDELKEFLTSKNVDSKIHYPIPIHEQQAWKDYAPDRISYPKTEKQSKEILSLPIFPELTDEQVDHVIQAVSQFFSA